MARPRPREAGVSPGLLPAGPHNAISDVTGVGVGHHTVHFGHGPLERGRGPARTGVTAVMPGRDNPYESPLPAAALVINGFGKAVGLHQLQELGELETPIVLTNTLSVPRAADALIDWMIEANPGIGIDRATVNAVVGECNDGYLNDIQGRHVTRDHVFSALCRAREHAASGGAVEGGAVGAGRGMMCLGFKGGVGTSSRLAGGLTVGVLVLANFGRRSELRIDGVPVGRMLSVPAPGKPGDGSIIIIIATDAPLSSRQLGRLCVRSAFGLARTGSTCSHGSGDFALAFSTGWDRTHGNREMVRDADLNPLFGAVVEATEEAILDALFRAETVVGRDGNTGHALPVEAVREAMGACGYPWPVETGVK